MTELYIDFRAIEENLDAAHVYDLSKIVDNLSKSMDESSISDLLSKMSSNEEPGHFLIRNLDCVCMIIVKESNFTQVLIRITHDDAIELYKELFNKLAPGKWKNISAIIQDILEFPSESSVFI